MSTVLPPPPPYNLVGVLLPSGWKIVSKKDKVPGETGGYFSVGYECEAGDKKAFLKAIDLYTPLQNSSGDVIKQLQPLLIGAQAEKELLALCEGMDRVVNILDAGDIEEFGGQKLLIPVPYIVFERAEATARSVVYKGPKPSHGWKLRTLHHVAVGLSQMHARMIAHQDVKLSNVLVFKGDQGAKISDLGRSVQQGRSVPHENLDWPGDWSYAPPESVYDYKHAEFNVRRLAADLYLLGSCAASVFCQAPLNALLYNELPKNFHSKRFGGAFSGQFVDVLPHLKDAFSRVIATIEGSIPKDAPYRADLVKMIQEWCDPDPLERGHPRTRALAGASGNAYDLERYLTTLDLLAHKAALFDKKSGKP